jgi:hypothetical protein
VRQGCGYAATHGRCDADDSSFSQSIEFIHSYGAGLLSTLQLMEIKQVYIDIMVLTLPLSLFSEDVQRYYCILQDRLHGYW